MLEKFKELLKKYRQYVLYVVFGAMTSAVAISVYALCIILIGRPLHLNETATFQTVSNGVAWGSGVLFAFFTNKKFVFESKTENKVGFFREFFSFVSARAFTGLLEIFIPPQLGRLGLNMKVFGVDNLFAKLVVGFVVIILNFVFSKFLVFRKSKNKSK